MQWTCGQLIVKIKHYSEWHFLLLNSHYSCLLPVLGLGDKFNFDKDKCCLCPSVEALRERIEWLLEEGYSPLLEPGSKLKGSFLSLSVTLSSSWPGVMIETGTSKDTREWLWSQYWELVVSDRTGLLQRKFFRPSSVWIYLSSQDLDNDNDRW